LPEWRLSRLTAADIEQIAAIDCAVFDRPWPVQTYRCEIERDDSLHAAVRSSAGGGSLCGFVFSRLHCGELDILRIATQPEWRRRGIAESLLIHCLTRAVQNGAARAVLEVRCSNAAARALYAKAGFTNAGRRPDYYPETGEDALIMARVL